MLFPCVSGIKKIVNSAITKQTPPKPKYVAGAPQTFTTVGKSFTTRNTVRKATHVTQPDVMPLINKLKENVTLSYN